MTKPTMPVIAVRSCFHTGQLRKSEAQRRGAAVRRFHASACEAPVGRAYSEAGIGFGRGRWAGSDGNRMGTSFVTIWVAPHHAATPHLDGIGGYLWGRHAEREYDPSKVSMVRGGRGR